MGIFYSYETYKLYDKGRKEEQSVAVRMAILVHNMSTGLYISTKYHQIPSNYSKMHWSYGVNKVLLHNVTKKYN